MEPRQQGRGPSLLSRPVAQSLAVVVGGAALFIGAIFLLSGHSLGWFIGGTAVGIVLGGLYLLGYTATILFVLAVVLTTSMFNAGQQYISLAVGLGLSIAMFVARRLWRGQRLGSRRVARQRITWEMYSSQVPTPEGAYPIKDVPTGEIIFFSPQSTFGMVLPPRKEENTFWYFLLTSGRVLRMRGDAPVTTGVSFEEQAQQYLVLREQAVTYAEEEKFGFSTLDRMKVGAWLHVMFTEPGSKPAVLAQYLGENHIRYWEKGKLVDANINPGSIVLHPSGYIIQMAERHV